MKAGSSMRPQKAQVKDKGLGAESELRTRHIQLILLDTKFLLQVTH
jgi:hypothetical protein